MNICNLTNAGTAKIHIQNPMAIPNMLCSMQNRCICHYVVALQSFWGLESSLNLAITGLNIA